MYTTLTFTHKVDSTKTAMANLSKVCKDPLWIFLAEKASYLWVLGIAWPGQQRHGPA